MAVAPTAPTRAPAPGTVLGAAAHEGLRAPMHAPTRRATPLAATRAAVILAVPGERPVAVVSADAVRLPGSMVLGAPSGHLGLAAFGPGTPAWIGDGRVQVGDLVVRPTRWWRSRTPHRATAATLATSLAQLTKVMEPVGHEPRLTARLEAGQHELAAAVLAALDPARRPSVGGSAVAAAALERTRAAAVGLLGLGPGLTPSGDDMTSGTLIAVRRLMPSTADEIAAIGSAIATLALSRTSPVSAALLSWAGLGEGVPELLAFVDGLGTGSDPAPALAALARVGHTSGRDLAQGAVAGARIVLELLRPSPETAELVINPA
ncbi:MAG TPA: DUF2877 domain-containing protein [Actinomycetes bacterium]|nr:DUF2877 domain-containing protein [Actinomycetes bacterium]